MTHFIDRPTQLHELAAIIRLLFWHGHRQSAEAMEHLGMTMPQAVVLFGLDANGGQSTMTELVRLTQQSAGTLTGIVDRLITAGLVERSRDDDDRRVVWVRITAAGLTKMSEINDQREADIARMTVDFNDVELTQFTGLMGRLLVGVEAVLDK
jgi:DNA-binding MarR family transcriptional regulator